MKVGFVSLGCPKNLVDSEVMLGLVRQAGHEITNRPDEADALVVNTCAFVDAATQESIDAILEMAALKRSGRCTRLIVTGCLGQRFRDALCEQIPEVDLVLGTGDVPAIVRAIEEAAAPPVQPAPALPAYLYDAETPRHRTTPRHYAYVKVAEGCDYKCAFCIIPTLRGRYRSRAADSIVKEVERLVGEGTREVILISQDTTFYGLDRGERRALSTLLRRLNRIDGLGWIRLLYLYPTTIGDDVLDAMAECDKVCRYVDLPLQHASRSVLARMKRPGDGATYEALVQRIRQRVPGVTLRTTFIVGFPGETEQDFGELLAFLERAQFDHVGVFTYSHEEGTGAYALVDDVPVAIKRARARRLMAAQRRHVRRRHRRLVGTRHRLLVDGYAADAGLVLQGRLQSQAPEIDPVVFLTEADPDRERPGEFVEVEIVASHGYDLVARPRVDRPAGDPGSLTARRKRRPVVTGGSL